ncbi:MAG: hypothetical protein LC104_12170 [Bacteroidales bacterium]|nr:hypothetical protein [Bacteroidales bacterium]
MPLRFWNCRSLAGLCAGLILGLTGCGDGKPDTVAVSGKVLYADGKPLPEGMIIFNPILGDDPAQLIKIQSDGTFSVTADLGVVPGDYRISLSPSEEGTVLVTEGNGEPKPSPFQVPDKYLDPDTSGWTATVAERDNAPFTFTISKSQTK